MSTQNFYLNDLDQLLEGQGVYNTPANIEICWLPGGSYFFVCDYPGRPPKMNALNLKLCEQYSALAELKTALHVSNKEELNLLTPERLLPFYMQGRIHVTAYWEEKRGRVWNLSFKMIDGSTYIVDFESNKELQSHIPLTSADEIIRFTWQYIGANRRY